jgi:hypothetical protein
MKNFKNITKDPINKIIERNNKIVPKQDFINPSLPQYLPFKNILKANSGFE